MTAPRMINFGCRLNMVETETMRRHAEAAGDPCLVVVNTCAVTAEAVRQARQTIRRTHRDDPDARIVVTGCAAQIDPESFAALPGVARVLGNAEKLEARQFRLDDGANTPIRVNDIMQVRETAGHLVDGLSDRARAFVEVQNGCDHRCTFCIIPFGRGPSRSVPAGQAVERIQRLVDQGYAEVVLTGVDLTSWGADLPGAPTLGTLVQRILRFVPDLKRLRLSSIDQIEVDEALLEAIVGETRVMPHIHLSLQHGDDMILKRMKRRHNRDDAIHFCAEVRARRPDVAFGADLIAGFPTESEAAFARTLDLVDACGLTTLHVFPYSARTGTPAARMPQVPVGVRKERAAQLRALGAARHAAWLNTMVGREAEIVVEGDGTSGHTPHYALARLRHPARHGALLRVRIVAAADTFVTAEAL